MLRFETSAPAKRASISGLAVAIVLAAPAGALAAAAPSAAIKVAVARARTVWHTQNVNPGFSVVSRRDRRWALVDGTAGRRNELWAAWLEMSTTGRWALRYFDSTAPFQPQPARNGRVPCDIYPAFSEARCPPSGPSRVQLRSQLGKQLVPGGPGAKIPSLLKNAGYTFRFKPPVNGSVSVRWYLATSGTPSNRIRASAKLIARGGGDFLTGRPGKLRIRLTMTGKRLLSGASSMRVTATATFTPILYASVVATRQFTLGR